MKKNNKLIAEFMGTKWHKEFFKSVCIISPSNISYKFHTSWNWLMPVVDKIEEMGFKTSIKTSYVRINPTKNAGYEHHISYITFNEDGWSSRKPYVSYDDDCDIGNISYNPKEIIDKRRAIFEAVVAFINWYNKNK